MVNTTTVSKFQQDMQAERDAEGADEIQTANPFAGLRIDVQADDEWGMAMHKVRTALLDAGRVASEEQIRAETSRLWGPAADTTTATIARNGKVDFVDMDSSEGQAIVEGVVRSAMGLPASELPGMPEKPAPKMVMRVPSDAEFGADGEEFFISSPLRARALELIDRHPDLFDHLSGMSLTYLWKKAGGKSKGAPTLGKTQKPAGLLKLFSESTFVIWLAADHCRARYYGDPEIEQLLFHEMLHTAVGEPDEETGRGGGPVLVPHQLEIFDAEIEVYGLDGIALKEAAPLFRQAVYNTPAVVEEQGQSDGSGLDCAECGSFVDPERDGQLCEACRHRAEMDRLPPEGQLIRPDGTPLTAEEIAEQEAAELRDDPAEDDDEDDDDQPPYQPNHDDSDPDYMSRV